MLNHIKNSFKIQSKKYWSHDDSNFITWKSHQKKNNHPLLVGGLEHCFYLSIQLGMSSQLAFIFFRGVGQPTTSLKNMKSQFYTIFRWTAGGHHGLGTWEVSLWQICWMLWTWWASRLSCCRSSRRRIAIEKWWFFMTFPWFFSWIFPGKK